MDKFFVGGKKRNLLDKICNNNKREMIGMENDFYNLTMYLTVLCKELFTF